MWRIKYGLIDLILIDLLLIDLLHPSDDGTTFDMTGGPFFNQDIFHFIFQIPLGMKTLTY